jgi:hypothetical protein
VVERDDGIERELAVAHALGEDDVPVPVWRFRADPRNVRSLALVKGALNNNLPNFNHLAFGMI